MFFTKNITGLSYTSFRIRPDRASNANIKGFADLKKPPPKPQLNKAKIQGVKQIIAVAAGKGGVGKSTLSVNLAIGLSSLNKKVALLDADIYGPSVPLLMNLSGMKPEVSERKFLIPLENYGVKCMSMGFLVDKDAPVIWRGLMVMSALEQLLRQTEWGDVDIMVIDLPPGTGDAQLSICQRAPLSGAVVICTPQDLALLDAVKATNMFKKVDVPILGLVQNMSYFLCSNCNEKHFIFGNEGVRRTAESMSLAFLGDIPLHPKIRELSDLGKPITIADPKSPQAQSYIDIAKQVVTQLDAQQAQQQQPSQ